MLTSTSGDGWCCQGLMAKPGRLQRVQESKILMHEGYICFLVGFFFFENKQEKNEVIIFLYKMYFEN